MNSLYHLSEYYLLNQLGGANRWSTLEHNGVEFVPLYKPHNIPIKYNGKEIHLPPLAEEYATLYAKFIDTEYVKSRTFRKNFFSSWKPTIKGLGINDLEGCDFSKIAKYIEQLALKKKELTKEEKIKAKEERDKIELKYKKARVDGKEQAVGNFRLEPPNIFLGRGCHPLSGTVKQRIEPKDIILNISKGIPIPLLPDFYSNQKYKKIVHDKKGAWLASWKDNISGKTKYVWLGNNSDFKAQSDIEKFDKARKLGKHIEKLRKINNENLESKDNKIKQLATALYFIDNLALRVGNEKGEDEADTVGVTSLRIEHIKLLDNNIIKLDFLGKDSIRFVKETEISDVVLTNIKAFINNKKNTDELFDLINSNDVNSYIKSLIPDMTAKVFRTYNASITFQNELNAISKQFEKYKKDDKIDLLLNSYNKANAKVAMLCNHQKNVNKNHNDALKKLKDKMLDYKNKIKELLDKKDDKSKKKIKKLKEQIKKYTLKKEAKIELKNISLGTSKTNYIDPRISIAFIKKHNIPINKIFTNALIDKFFWAIDIDENFKF